MSNKEMEVPIWERFLLTVKEASLYFNIGENKLHRITNDYIESEYKYESFVELEGYRRA